MRKANAYQGLNGLTAKQQYYKKADGRDEDLKDIDENSSEAFDNWFRNRENRIGHPWEVCAGGVAVYLYDAKGIKERLCGEDIIGIVPEHVTPVYCESWFPNMEILDFMNLPYELEDYEKMLPKVKWLPEQEQKLL